MNGGWIKIWRKMVEWEWSDDPNTLALFVHLLLLANHQEKAWRGVSIKAGELVTGRKELSKKTGISEQTLRTCLDRLKSTSEITIKSTNKFSLISICNWAKYQGEDSKSTSKSTSKLTINQPTTNHKQEVNKKLRIEEEYKQEHLTTNTPSRRKSAEPSSEEPGTNDVLKAFYDSGVNPSIKFGNPFQRKAAAELSKKLGAGKVVEVVNSLAVSNLDRFAPKIYTPTQLLEKWPQLRDWWARKNSGENSNYIDLSNL